MAGGEPLVGMRDIVMRHWARYEQHFYCRYDYKGVKSDAANRVMDTIREKFVDGNLRAWSSA